MVGSNVQVLGNLIGTDVTGMLALGNTVDGILIPAVSPTNALIGGTDAGSRNVISGNGRSGIPVRSDGAGGDTVQGNYIGTDVNGAPTLGNRGFGIEIGSNCVIGGMDPRAGNLIAGNGYGIACYGSNDQVIGNVIDYNVVDGFSSSGTNGLVMGNSIHNNGGAGVSIGFNSALGNTLSANSIYANGGLGIDLLENGASGVAGVTLNDSEGHDGPNHFQNFPILTVPHCGAVTDTLHSTPNTTFRIEFFGNAQADPSGYGEGQTYLGSSTVTTDATGYASSTTDLPALLPGMQFVTATATNLSTGDTSEFSQTITIPAKSDQTISPNWPSRALNTSSVTLNLTSTSGLPVTYSVSGPAKLNSNNVLTITALGTVTVTAHQVGDDCNNPAPDISTTYTVAPGSLSGILFKDFNEDGFQDYGELSASGITVQLTGTDFNGTAVSQSYMTATSGYYQFANLLPGTYAVSIPSGLTVTKVTVGLNGSPPAVVGNGHSAAGLAIVEGTSLNFVNFGLEPAAGEKLHDDQTAGIGFWNNKKGQALIKSLNGGTGTQLGSWLAATFPHMFGAAGHDLTHNTNAQVAAYLQALFANKGDKLEAQVLATALSVYVTNSTLAGGTYAQAYDFTVVANGGTGLATISVRSNGAAVGQANGTTMTIMDILLAADRHATRSTTAVGFVLYNGDQCTRESADDLCDRINDIGDSN